MEVLAIRERYVGSRPLLSAISVIAVAYVVYLVARSIYWLYFCPIAKFPGPKLAAITFWYEFYYDVIKGGQYTFKIKELHKQFGPVVRINPYELHVETPDFYDTVYAGGGKKRDKWWFFIRQFGTLDSVFGTAHHEKHRVRRAAINPFFSKAAVRRLQPVIDERVDMFLSRVAEYQESGQEMVFSTAFAAFTCDIAMQYAFGRSDHHIEQEGFNPAFHAAAKAGASTGGITKQFPWVRQFMQSLPDFMIARLNMASYVHIHRGILRQVANIIATQDSPDWKDISHPTIFHSILTSSLPASEKTFSRLWQDGQATIFAGTLTTAWTLSVGLFYITSQPPILQKLKVELAAAIPDPNSHPNLASLERLPFLTACIQESLRLAYGVAQRLPRIAPNESLLLHDARTGKDWVIPPGTPVSMSSALVHHDEAIFPDSRSFVPERWLDPLNSHLDRYLVSFSKGSRQCVGMNLAYAEMYLMFGRLLRSYGTKDVQTPGDLGILEPFETDVEDVRIWEDKFVPWPKPGSEGVRFRVLKK